MSIERPIFIGFGGNLGDPLATLQRAIPLLEAQIGPRSAISSLYETVALTIDGEAQPNYLNAVIQLVSPRQPEEILTALLDIERQLGRDRSSSTRWAPRVIDLDLLFVGDLCHDSGSLILPHPEIARRDFVLTPLAEIAPDFRHPSIEERIAALEQSLEARGFARYVVSCTSAPWSKNTA